MLLLVHARPALLLRLERQAATPQSGRNSNRGECETRRRSPPLGRTVQMSLMAGPSGFGDGSTLVNAIRVPSGDQDGLKLVAGPAPLWVT
jgi:hypothetical protein